MANILSPSHLMFLALFTTPLAIHCTIIPASPSPAASPESAPPLPPPPTAAPPPPFTSSPPPSLPSQFQPPPLNGYNILDALIGAGDFSKWVSILSMLDNPLSSLSLTATLFIPETSADSLTSSPNLEPFVFPYHIVPQRLSFSELLLLKDRTRLPTLLPGKSILITDSSSFNFTVDNVPITRPDLYTTANVAVHGVGSLLDYSTYGDDVSLLPKAEITVPPSSSPYVAIGQTITWRSKAACLCAEFPMLFLGVCGVAVYTNMEINVRSC